MEAFSWEQEEAAKDLNITHMTNTSLPEIAVFRLDTERAAFYKGQAIWKKEFMKASSL